MEAKDVSRSNSRSRRSHTNLSNLRLAPLSPEFTPGMGAVGTTDLSFQNHHSSYIQGRSAPSTPGILGRSSSRRQLGGGLSRKLSIYDTNAPAGYAAVEVTREGIPLNALRPDAAIGTIPKAKSEAALLSQQQRRHHPPKLQTQLSHHSPSSSLRHHRRSQTVGRPQHAKEEDWMTRAGLATTSILRESKGQSWLVSRTSSTSLAANAADLSSDDDDGEAYTRLSASSHQRLHFADDEFSPETPRYTSRWGSRFGSRAASARTSRRGSFDQARTPTISVSQHDYFGPLSSQSERGRGGGGGGEDVIKPDFVDLEESLKEEEEEDAEAEIARLARERSFGLGGLVDRLVGWTLFNVDEDREATDVEDDEKDKGRVGVKRVDENTSTATLPTARKVQAAPPRQTIPEQTQTTEAQEEGGWHDAAWLLSLASKVIL